MSETNIEHSSINIEINEITDNNNPDEKPEHSKKNKRQQRQAAKEQAAKEQQLKESEEKVRIAEEKQREVELRLLEAEKQLQQLQDEKKRSIDETSFKIIDHTTELDEPLIHTPLVSTNYRSRGLSSSEKTQLNTHRFKLWEKPKEHSTSDVSKLSKSRRVARRVDGSDLSRKDKLKYGFNVH